MQATHKITAGALALHTSDGRQAANISEAQRLAKPLNIDTCVIELYVNVSWISFVWSHSHYTVSNRLAVSFVTAPLAQLFSMSLISHFSGIAKNTPSEYASDELHTDVSDPLARRLSGRSISSIIAAAQSAALAAGYPRQSLYWWLSAYPTTPLTTIVPNTSHAPAPAISNPITLSSWINKSRRWPLFRTAFPEAYRPK